MWDLEANLKAAPLVSLSSYAVAAEYCHGVCYCAQSAQLSSLPALSSTALPTPALAGQVQGRLPAASAELHQVQSDKFVELLLQGDRYEAACLTARPRAPTSALSAGGAARQCRGSHRHLTTPSCAACSLLALAMGGCRTTILRAAGASTSRPCCCVRCAACLGGSCSRELFSWCACICSDARCLL